MNLKPISAVAAIAVALLMTTSAAGQGLPLIMSGGANDSWISDSARTWSNAGPGNYNNNECSWIETPLLPGALLAVDPTMKFDYTFNLERSSFSGLAYDGSVVAVSVDQGATWALLDTGLENSPNVHSTTNACVTGMGGPAPASVISDIGSGSADIDLSGAVAPTDLFQVRIVLSTDGSVTRDGWTVSGISVAGLPLA